MVATLIAPISQRRKLRSEKVGTWFRIGSQMDLSVLAPPHLMDSPLRGNELSPVPSALWGMTHQQPPLGLGGWRDALHKPEPAEQLGLRSPRCGQDRPAGTRDPAPTGSATLGESFQISDAPVLAGCSCLLPPCVASPDWIVP